MSVLGLECKLYRNTGSYGSPVWNEITNAKDVTLSLSKDSADVTTRGNSGWKATRSTLKDAEVSFDLLFVAGDADYDALRDAWLNNTELDVAVMSGAIASSGSEGLRAVMDVFQFERSEPLAEAVVVKVTLKPAYDATNPPDWLEI